MYIVTAQTAQYICIHKLSKFLANLRTSKCAIRMCLKSNLDPDRHCRIHTGCGKYSSFNSMIHQDTLTRYNIDPLIYTVLHTYNVHFYNGVKSK